MTTETILINDTMLGEITIADLLDYFDYLIKENNDCQNILKQLLKTTNLQDQDIASIINKFDFGWNIQFIKDILLNSLN